MLRPERLGVIVLFGIVVAGVAARATKQITPRSTGVSGRLNAIPDFGRIPLQFERNQGQAHPSVRFLTRGRGATIFLTGNETVMVLGRSNRLHPRRRILNDPDFPTIEQASVRMTLVGGRGDQAEGLEPLPGITNYFLGNDPANWHTDIPNYAKVRFRGVYEGIDVVYYGRGRRLEYDFVIRPGADPSRIEMAWDGAESVRLDDSGDVVLTTKLGEVRQQKPRVYQEVNGRRVAVEAGYKVREKRVTFSLAQYSRSRTLVIDPVVSYSTYLGGGSVDQGSSIAVDSTGSAYVTGQTASTDFPLESAAQSGLKPPWDIFVVKLAPAGNAVLYSTYIGGDFIDAPNEIAVDSYGAAYLTGGTSSTNFPTQSPVQTRQADWDVFVTKLSPAGNALLYSTYLGGNKGEFGMGIAVDSLGSAYITGQTESADFPTQSPYQAHKVDSNPAIPYADAFVTKLSPAGNALVYSTYLGGRDYDIGSNIAVDGGGAAYIVGGTSSPDFPTVPFQAVNRGVFVTKLAPPGNSLTYSRHVGNGTPLGIAVDDSGYAYITGFTTGSDFPVVSAFQTAQADHDAFVTKLSREGDAFVYSTYLGGGGLDWAVDIAVDSTGSAYVTGYTESSDFPTASPVQGDQPGTDAFVTKLNPTGNALVYSTYLGGSGLEQGTGIAVDGNGSAYVVGWTESANFPTQSPYQSNQPDTDIFVTKLQETGPTTTIASNPVGRLFTIDRGLPMAAPRSFHWNTGEQHLIDWASPQIGAAGVRYVFAGWSDRQVSASRTLVAGTIASSYSANFITQYQLTTTVDPPGSGVITPVPGYYNAGSLLQVAAIANSGYRFSLFNFDLYGTVTPLPLTMNGPKNVIAYFDRIQPQQPPLGGLNFVPVTPCRVADTRLANGPFGGPPLQSQSSRSFNIPASACGIPGTAKAYSINVTVVPRGSLGYLTLWPTGQAQPWVSTLNSQDGTIVANAAIVPAGINGAISVFVTNTTDVIIDINGFFGQ